MINLSSNNTEKSKLNVVILAAGSSSRLGVPKQLLPWKGKTLLNHTIDQFRQLDIKPFVVLGAYSESIRPTIDLPDNHVLLNESYHEGLSTSIQLAIQKIGHFSQTILFTLSDLPLITSEHYQRLISASGDEIVASTVQGKKMVPAIFPKSAFPLLEQISGDRGARNLLNSSTVTTETMAVDNCWVDVDTLEDYQNLVPKYGEVQ